MNIAIIVYTHTGHTLAAARGLERKLSQHGHQVRLEQIETVGPVNFSAQSLPIQRQPEIGHSDAIVFATPVHGGRISAAMRTYLDAIGSLKGKKTICLISHFLFPKWGRDQVYQQMREICASKGAAMLGFTSFWRLKPNRQREIEKAAAHIQSLLVN